MKKSLPIALLIILLLILSGCAGDLQNSTPSTTNDMTQTTETTEAEQKRILVEPSQKATPVKENIYTTNISKDHVPEFMELFETGSVIQGLSSGYAYDEAHCYNVTPAIFSYMTDMKIFKFSNSCASFLLLDGEIYPLCKSFGGYGFVDAILCDFDEDGNLDLLVSSSWGSGMRRSILSVFNTATKESTTLCTAPGVDIYAVCASPASSVNDPIVPCSIKVDTIEITINDSENFGSANLSWTAKEEVGYVYIEGGTVKFFPWDLKGNPNG